MILSRKPSSTPTPPALRSASTPRRQLPYTQWAFVRELVLTCRSQKVTSSVIVVISALAIALVLGTAGLSAASQAKVLSTVDEAGTRSVTIYSKKPDQGFPVSILDSLERLDIVEEVVGFGMTTDVTNGSIVGGHKVALRTVYGRLARDLRSRVTRIGIQSDNMHADPFHYAFASPDALELLALPPQGGGVQVINDGIDIAVVGQVQLSESFARLTPTLLMPAQTDTGLTAIYLSAKNAHSIPLLTDLVRAHMREFTNEDYALSTSEQYAQLRAAINGELTESSHLLIVSVLLAGAGITMLVVWAVVLLRRKDLGRRRALGASRIMIVSLTMGQVGLLTALGSATGIAASYGVMHLLTSPLPPVDFAGALLIALSSASTLLSLVPALWAANRDPLAELRVP